MKLEIFFLLAAGVVFALAESQCEGCSDLQCNSTEHCCLTSTIKNSKWKRTVFSCGNLGKTKSHCSEQNSDKIYVGVCPCRQGLECREDGNNGRVCMPRQSSTSTSSSTKSPKGPTEKKTPVPLTTRKETTSKTEGTSTITTPEKS